MCKRREAGRRLQPWGGRLRGPPGPHGLGPFSRPRPNQVRAPEGAHAQSDRQLQDLSPVQLRLRIPLQPRPSREPPGQPPRRATEAAALGFRQHGRGLRATRKFSHFALSGLGGCRAPGRRATMGSSKKHRGEKEVAGTTAAAGTGGATEQPPRHREHKKHKHRSGGGGSSGGERRKRSRERGAERGGGRRGAETEARSGAHGRERSQAEPSERRVKREKRDDGYEAGEGGACAGGGAGGRGSWGCPGFPGAGGSAGPARQAEASVGWPCQRLLKCLLTSV